MLNKLQLEAFNVEESLESANQVLEKIVGDPSFYTEQRSQHLTVLDSKQGIVFLPFYLYLD